MPFNPGNTGYVKEQKIYCPPGVKHILVYSEDEHEENHLFNILQNSKDLSIGSQELEAHIHDWPTRYHLSGKRADVWRPFAEQLRNKRVLEIGSGAGSVTRYLGELGCNVIALESNIRRAFITAERCRDLENVTVICDNVQDFTGVEKFDFVILTGVLQDGSAMAGSDGCVEILQKSKVLLADTGNLLVAIDNKLGLKYWAGAPEGQEGKSYLGIQGLNSAFGHRTYSRNEITSLIMQAGFATPEFMYPFPDHKFADVIVTDQGFATPGFEASEILLEKFEYFQSTWYESQFNSTLAARSLFSNELLPLFANSFIIIAGAQTASTPGQAHQALAYVYSTSRNKQFCKETIFSHEPDQGTVVINRKWLYNTGEHGTALLQQALFNEKYIRGEVLLGTVLPIVSVTGWATENLINWARSFFEIILSLSFQKDQQRWLAGKYTDVTPFNIILSDGQPQLFDLEWVCQEDIPCHYVFFRGIFYSLGRILYVNQPARGTPLEIVQLAARITRHYFPFADAEFADCRERELRYFSDVAMKEITDPFPNNELNVRHGPSREIFEANKKLLSQNDELLSQLQQQRQKLEGEIREHQQTKARKVDLFQQLISLKKDNKWYHDTYVNRSLQGVIRQKLSDRVTSVTTRIKNASVYSFIPGNYVLYNSETRLYSTAGADSFFYIDLAGKKLSAGWYWLNLEIDSGSENLESPKIYFNYGDGFNDRNICFLPMAQEGRITALVNFYCAVDQLRFDPSVSEAQFSIGKFSLKKISRFGAIIKTFKIYKTAFPGQTNSSILKMLLATRKKSGFAGLRHQLRKMAQANVTDRVTPYIQWCRRYDTLRPWEIEWLRKRSGQFNHQPLFSIVMPVYNPPGIFFKKAIESVLSQVYPNWELCIADDCSDDEKVKELIIQYQQKDSRVKSVFRESNGHISEASNSALGIARGDFIVLLDQDDMLARHALYLMAEAINENPSAALLYSDEDKIDEDGNRFDPYFKTGWNPDLFMGQNMISHLGVYKRSLVTAIGGFRKGFEGSQDYDLALRFIEKIKASQVIHIPHILYHWRAISGSTAISTDNKQYAFTAGLKALESFIQDLGLEAGVLPNVNHSYRVKWSLSSSPKASIIIPTKNKPQVLSNCVNSILQKTKYANYEIIIVDNNSSETAALEQFSLFTARDPRISVIQYSDHFNFSAINNYGAKKSTGEVLVLLNNDTEVINEDWLEELISQAMRDNVGAVGAKLLYPNGLIQHAGVFLYEGHPGIHIYQKKDKSDPGYFNKLNLVQNYSAVTAACLAVRKDRFEMVNGLNEQNLPIAYNDVDFCLRLMEKGFYNVWTPFSQLYHHESLSRGNDLDEVNIDRFKKEHAYMLNRWKSVVHADPFFNPNLAPETRITNYAHPPNVLFSWRVNNASGDEPSQALEMNFATEKMNAFDLPI